MLLDSWPADVVDQAVRRNLILIVGSGISASCIRSGSVRPPDWETLLRKLVSGLGITTRKPEIEKLIEQSRLLDAAELIRQEARSASRDQDFNKLIKEAVDGPISDNFQGSNWHESIVKMEPPIIVTTNYDRIIERATENGYNTQDYKSTSVAANIRRRDPTLLKIHGSVDNIEGIVVSRTDYTRLRLHGGQSLEVLQALLLTRTALLIGYRLRDPDIQLLFENVFGGRNESPAHYMLAPDDTPDYERDILRYSFGVNCVTYAAGNHDEAQAMFEVLADQVQSSPLQP